jgi:hypothetical protein
LGVKWFSRRFTSEEDGGKVLVVHAIGKLVKTDYPPFVAEFERRVGKHVSIIGKSITRM